MITSISTDFKSAYVYFSLGRNATDTTLSHTFSFINQQSFRRFILSKFPCNLKRIQASYEKLIELCAIDPGNKENRECLNVSIIFIHIDRR